VLPRVPGLYLRLLWFCFVGFGFKLDGLLGTIAEDAPTAALSRPQASDGEAFDQLAVVVGAHGWGWLQLDIAQKVGGRYFKTPGDPDDGKELRVVDRPLDPAELGNVEAVRPIGEGFLGETLTLPLGSDVPREELLRLHAPQDARLGGTGPGRYRPVRERRRAPRPLLPWPFPCPAARHPHSPVAEPPAGDGAISRSEPGGTVARWRG
jgi:hypothetical protein